MTVELVLLLSVYAFLILGAFLGDLGPIETFKKSAPRLGARIERNVATGQGFRPGKEAFKWVEPTDKTGID